MESHGKRSSQSDETFRLTYISSSSSASSSSPSSLSGWCWWWWPVQCSGQTLYLASDDPTPFPIPITSFVSTATNGHHDDDDHDVHRSCWGKVFKKFLPTPSVKGGIWYRNYFRKEGYPLIRTEKLALKGCFGGKTRTQVLELGPRDKSLLWSGLVLWCADDALMINWWCTDNMLMMH